jgi:hypothetical protein
MTNQKKVSLKNGEKRTMPDATGNWIDNSLTYVIFPVLLMLILDYYALNNFGLEAIILILNNLILMYFFKRN